jgi:hypothetical protein
MTWQQESALSNYITDDAKTFAGIDHCLNITFHMSHPREKQILQARMMKAIAWRTNGVGHTKRCSRCYYCAFSRSHVNACPAVWQHALLTHNRNHQDLIREFRNENAAFIQRTSLRHYTFFDFLLNHGHFSLFEALCDAMVAALV